jgi:hypothetical protein
MCSFTSSCGTNDSRLCGLARMTVYHFVCAGDALSNTQLSLTG